MEVVFVHILLYAQQINMVENKEKLAGKNETPACFVCGSKSNFFCSKNNFNIYKCKNCRLIFVWPTPSVEEDMIYDSNYFSGAVLGFGYVDYDKDKISQKGFLIKLLSKIVSSLPERGNLLDVGAATGYFVELASKFGFNSEGIDISSHSVSVGKKKGLNLSVGTIEKMNYREGHFDIITMLDVLEHLKNPKLSLNKACFFLRKDGLFVINTPDGSSFWARIFGSKWHSLVPPEHLFIFNKKSLKIILEELGFKIIYVRHPVKTFSVPYIVNTFFRWVGIKPNWLSKHLTTLFKSVSIPLPIGDNILILAKKF